MMATASAFSSTAEAGHFVDAYWVARGLAMNINPAVGAIFALLLLDASIVGASAVTLTTSYAFGDVFGLRQSLHRRVGEAKLFYGSYAAMVALAASVALLPIPLGLITTAVQVLAGILLPSATVFALLLCNDQGLLGPWVNRPWLNVVAVFIVGVLLSLSTILVITTVFTTVSVSGLAIVCALVVALATGATAGWSLRAAPLQPEFQDMPLDERQDWRMPALALLQRPPLSAVRRGAMVALSGYVILAVLMLVVKAVQLALGS
jgi:hypothetical protein